jgi:hypothetical protein
MAQVFAYRGYVIKRDPVTTMFHIHSQSGALPLSLTGLFTHQRAYESVIDAYLSAQEFAEQERIQAEEAAKILIAETIKADAEKFEELKVKAAEINSKRKADKE